MSDLFLIRNSLFRKVGRTSLLIFAIFIAFLIFGVLASLQRAFYADGAASNRLVASNRIIFTESLPIAYVERARNVDGVQVVAHSMWFGGYYQEPRNFLFTFAISPEEYLQAYPEFVLPADQREAFIRNRDSLLVGREIAEKFGWQVGDAVPLLTNIWQRTDGSYAYPLVLRGIYDVEDNDRPTNAAFLHFEYFDEARAFGNDTTGQLIIVTEDVAANETVMADVDALFANSRFETETVTESTFNRAFADQLGSIGLILTSVVSAAFVTILLIVGNTMVMAIRQRTREYAVMKSIGFTNGRMFRLVLAESVALMTIGGALGLAAAAGVAKLIEPVVSGFAPGFSVTAGILGLGFAIMDGLGLLTGAVPAWSAMRLKVIDGLGRG